MRVLVTGSAGHLGEALLRMLAQTPHEARGLDAKPSAFTRYVGSIIDRSFVRSAMSGVDAVLHTAALHKPHVATHARQDFIDTNITGTLQLLEEAVAAGVQSFIYTSSTSVFGRALLPGPGEPAAWITEEVMPQPRNIYGVTKLAAEHLCELFPLRSKLACIVLRTARFFPEDDDDDQMRAAYSADNLKVNELLHRRADIEDVAAAHLAALAKAGAIGFGRYIISAATPFGRDERAELRTNAAAVVKRHIPDYEPEYARRGWRMFSSIGRVYDPARAATELGWRPRHDFRAVIARLKAGEDHRSPLARAVGAKGYHTQVFTDGPYPTE